MVLSSFKQNIANNNMQDAYYTEISPSETGLKILIAQSRDTPAYIEYLILNPKTRKLLLFLVHKCFIED